MSVRWWRNQSASYDDLSDGYERISRFHLSQLAYLAESLDKMPEGEGGPGGSTTT